MHSAPARFETSFLSQRVCGQPPAVSLVHQRGGPQRRLVIEAKQITRLDRTQKRHKRIRNKVDGDTERPRLAVYRSNQHIYAQVIDDTVGSTLAAASTLTADIRSNLNGGGGGNKEAAQMVGKKIAELCLSLNIDKVCFDRGGNVYHGRVQALADAAREGGLAF